VLPLPLRSHPLQLPLLQLPRLLPLSLALPPFLLVAPAVLQLLPLPLPALPPPLLRPR
jgi:hypothetical protein